MNEGKVSRSMRDLLIERARHMRAEPTRAEAMLWENLRKRQLGGLKFRRQHIIHVFIVDLYCAAAKLAIEIDGSMHAEQEEYDQEREAYLEAMGYETIHFGNLDVAEDVEMVLAGIYDACMARIGRGR